MAANQLPIDLDDVVAAARRIAGVANRTPVFTSRALDKRLGATVHLKAESFQRGGAFKFRGACNTVMSLSQAELDRGVVASSSGNHAQALAIAARLNGTQATILMPRDAPVSKRAATEEYGARVIEFDRYADDLDALVGNIVDREGMTPVHPYDDPRVMAGAGTSTLELLEQAGPLDLVLIPAGGGGQLAGGVVAASGAADGPRVVGVEPAAVGQWRASLDAGRPTRVEVGQTVADGQQLPAPGALTFPVVQELVEDVVGVTDEQMLSAMAYLFERQKLAVEPSGASAVAAALSGLVDVRGLRVGIVLSGGNIAVDRFLSLLAESAVRLEPDVVTESPDPLARLAELGLQLPAAPQPNATYVPTTRAGDLLYVSGQLPFDEYGAVPVTGKLGIEHDVESGKVQARVCALNLLAQVQHALGDLRHVEQVLKLQVYVAATPSFAEHHLVANGISDLLADVLGAAGVGARSAFGVAGLPFDSPVEVDAIVRVRPV